MLLFCAKLFYDLIPLTISPIQKKFSHFSNSLFIERNETSPAFLIISKFQTNSYSLILNSIGRLSRQGYRSSQNDNQSVSKEAIR